MEDFAQVETADEANNKGEKGIEVFAFLKKYFMLLFNYEGV